VRIAHVSDCYLPRTGGIETQVRALAMRQAGQGDEVRVITATPGHESVFAGDDVVDGLAVHRVAARLPFELPVHPRTKRSVAAILEEHPVDVVHVHAGVVSPFAWGAIRAAVGRGVPTLVTVHSVWGGLASPGFGLSDRLLRWSGRGLRLSAVSAVAASRVADAVPGLGEVLVVPNGIDVAEWRVIPSLREPGVLRIVSVMRMAPRKRIMPLVRVLEVIIRTLEPSLQARAVLVGDGPERGGAERWVRSRGLADMITFTGRLSREGILATFADSDVFVQPSIKESFGIAALEARTAGLPVVIRSQTGSTEFIHEGVEGLVADTDGGLASAVVRLGRDPDLLNQITLHNRMSAPEQAWPNVLGIVHAAYESAGATG